MIIDSVFEELGGNLSEPVTPIAEPSTLPPLTFKGGSSPSSYNGEIKPSSSKSANYAYNYYVGKGLPKHIAAGIVGNLMQESNLNPNIVNKQSGAYGVAQWLGSRKTRYLSKYGKTNTFENQLDFVLEELDTTEKKAKDKLFKTKNTQEATTVFANDFERMGQHEANHPRRLKNAMSLNPYKYGGKLPKHALGALLALGSGVNNLLGETVASFNGDKPYMDKGLGAVSGFFKGNAALPGIGGIVGGVKGYLDAQKEKKIYDQAQANKQREFTDAARIRSTMTLNPNVQNKGVYSYYAKGGQVENPQYEVEKDEIVTGDAQLTNSTPLASGIQQVTGYTHEENNPETGGTGVHGSGGDKVYSNSIMLGSKTIAGHAKDIAKKIGKQEKTSAKTDSIGRQTATLNVYKYKQQLTSLFDIQESMKMSSAEEPVFKYGGTLPKYKNGVDLTAEEAYEQAYKNLEKTAKARASKQANAASKKAADLAYEAAYKTEKEVAKKVGEAVVKKTTERLGSTIMKGLGVAGRLATAAQVYGTAGAMTYAGIKDAEKRGGFHSTYGYYAGMKKPSNMLDIENNKNKPASKPYIDMFKQYEVPKPVAPKPAVSKPGKKPATGNVPNVVNPSNIPVLKKPTLTIPNDGTSPLLTPQKPILETTSPNRDYRDSVQGALGTLEMSGVTKPKGFNWADAAESVAPFISSAANYLAVNNGLNKIDTNVPVSTIQASPYNYYDRSGLARNTLRQGLGSVLRNDNISAANKQNAFAQFLGAGNQLEDAERNAKLQYDSDYANRAWQIDAQNNAMITDAQRQRIGMKNEVRQAKINNTNNLFQNVNTGVQQLSRMTNDRKKLDILARSYPNMGKDVLADIYKILQP